MISSYGTSGSHFLSGNFGSQVARLEKIFPGLDGSYGGVSEVAMQMGALEIGFIFLKSFLSLFEHSLSRI